MTLVQNHQWQQVGNGRKEQICPDLPVKYKLAMCNAIMAPIKSTRQCCVSVGSKAGRLERSGDGSAVVLVIYVFMTMSVTVFILSSLKLID